jgi:hypothetical protein
MAGDSNDSIAVFLREDAPARPEDADAIRVAAPQGDGIWRTEKTLPQRLDFTGPGPLNKSLRALVEELGGCRVVLAKAVAGIPYHVFVHSGFEVYESEDASDATLTAILAETKALAAAARAGHEDPADVPTTPQPTSVCGVYALDLGRMQRAHPEVSTKMALKEFLKTDFRELRLTFSHVPPWLAADVALAKATMLSTEPEPGTWKVVIRKSGTSQNR